MAEWTKEESNKFTALYKQLTSLPGYDRIKDEFNAELFPKTEPLSYSKAESKLLNKISELSGHGGLEKKMNIAAEQKGVFTSFLEGIGGVFSNPYIGPVATAASVMMLLYI